MSGGKKKTNGNMFVRMFKRLFYGPGKELSVLEEEQLQTPLKNIMKNFRENKVAMTGLIVFLLIFSSVFVVPFLKPLDKSYQEVTQQNISPGRNFLKVAKPVQKNPNSIGVGATFSVGISEKGEAYLWGKYSKRIAKLPRGMKNIVQVSAGDDHALALDANGKVYAWGSNRFKQASVPMDLQMANNIKQVLAGSQISLAVTEDGQVHFWGNSNLINFYADEYQGKIDKVVSNTSAIMGLTKDGQVVVLSRKESTFTKIPENLGKIVDIALTGQVACVVDENGTLTTWGNSSKGEEKVPKISGKVVSLNAGRYHFTALTEDGKVYAWGDNSFNQCKIPNKIENKDIKEVYTGYYQNYAIDTSGNVYAWGLKGYLLGSDGFGRDIFTRLMAGGRLTMTIGAIAVIIQTIIGVIIGGIAGYYGGKIDNFLMRLAEVVNSLPFLPFAMILSSIVGNKMTQVQRIMMIMVILGVLSWPGMARLVRAQVLAEREKEFVTAARAIGVKQKDIIFRHIIPNVISFVIVSATLSFAASMLTESSLSFLGFGVVEPTPTWGNMLTGSQNSKVISVFWWRWVFPALALSLATISINLIGDGLRDAIDPKSNER